MRKYVIALLFLALAVAIGWGYREREFREQQSYALEAEYNREFYNLIANVEQAEVLLSKAIASNSTGQRIMLLTEVWSRSLAAQDSLSQIPFNKVNMTATRKFLSQTADYSRVLARNLASGEKISGEQYQKLIRFHSEMGSFARELHNIERRVSEEGDFRWSERRVARAFDRIAAAVRNEGGDALDGFVDINQRMEELPSLIYDGPFSDHLNNISPRGLTGKNVSQNEAASRVRRFLQNIKEDSDSSEISAAEKGEAAGKIPSWTFSFRTENREGPPPIRMDVSKKGGHVVWMLNNRDIDQSKLTSEEAVSRAVAFLQEQGLNLMEPVQLLRQDNAQVISFVFKKDGIIYYPDQIKVKVALDNGEIVGYDAVNYLTAHGKRQIQNPAITAEEAMTKVHPSFKIEKVRQALIPLDNGQEVYAYEIRASRNGDEFLVYINAESGKEERIYKIIKDIGGSVIM